jgi:serine/threonine protein kinase
MCLGLLARKTVRKCFNVDVPFSELRTCFQLVDIATSFLLLNKSIMYRDIKPENIGFDVRGDIKLFDFGLAREFDPKTRLGDGMYPNMTGDTGSPRYMDPQVALSKSYNELCDVYSFCILLWEMLELITPFLGFTMTMFTKKVVEGGSRPRINPEWSKVIQTLLSNGFGDIHKRKTMRQVCELIQSELNKEGINKDLPIVGTARARLSRPGLRKSVLSARTLMAERNSTTSTGTSTETPLCEA